jgi:hypothetical protein
VLQAIETAADAANAAARIRARILAAGYEVNSWALPPFLPAALYALGDPRQPDGAQGWFFAQKLREYGVI